MKLFLVERRKKLRADFVKKKPESFNSMCDF